MADAGENFAQATFDSVIDAMYRWDGGQSAPGFSHWTPDGVYQIVIAQKTMPMVVNVLFNGEWMGSGIQPGNTCAMIHNGDYDRDFGFSPKEKGLPGNLLDWNNLGGSGKPRKDS
jgi:hypothetical protein